MRVQFKKNDRQPLDWGLAKIGTMSENIVKMGTFLRITTPSAAKHSAACERAKSFLSAHGERPEGFAGEVEVDDEVREVLYTAALAWLREVSEKIVPGQTKLSLGTTEADKRRIEVENLRDRLVGIIGIFDAHDGTPDDAPASAERPVEAVG